MSWIKITEYDDAEGRLRKTYERIGGSTGELDNIVKVHGHRPHTLEGHMALYKSVLHHSGNTVPRWFLETLGVYVSNLNGCDYCVKHHFAGLERILDDTPRAEAIGRALQENVFDPVFEPAERCALEYAKALTQSPNDVQEGQVQELISLGYSEGQVLEINQVVSYFNYANRTVLGLGVTTEGDVLGTAPTDAEDEENWRHQ